MNTDVQVIETTALQAMTKAEYDMQITTAKRFPRDLKKVRLNALSLATQDTEIARSCFYGLKRSGKRIEGPSVRLAEIIASQWQNLRVQSRVVETTANMIRAQGVAHDLENNVAYSTEVSVRITNKQGVRYSDDMIVVSGNAACAKAMRNVVFKAVPYAYVKPILEQAKKTAVGNAATLNDRKSAALNKFQELGVSKEQMVTYLEVNSWEDVGLMELEDLLGAYTAIEDGTTTVEETFKPKQKKAPPTEDKAAPEEPKSSDEVPPAPPSKEPGRPKTRCGRPPKRTIEDQKKDPVGEQPPAETVPEEPVDNTIPLPESKTASTSYNTFRQKYNFAKAKLCTEFGTDGTNDFISHRLEESGKTLDRFTDEEWQWMIDEMNNHFENK